MCVCVCVDTNIITGFDMNEMIQETQITIACMESPQWVFYGLAFIGGLNNYSTLVLFASLCLFLFIYSYKMTLDIFLKKIFSFKIFSNNISVLQSTLW